MPVTAAAIDHLRERSSAFARFVWRRFRDDRCFESAGALSFTTVFALVPLSAAVLGIMAAFPVFETWSRQLTDYLFENYVPAAAKAVKAYLTEFASNASQLTVVGGVVLLASALLMMAGIEDTLNRIWRAPGHRRRAARFVAYWTVLTLGPILLAASLGLSSYLFALPLVDRADRQLGLSQHLLTLLPFLTTWSALTLAFMVVPNAAVGQR
jgi:membrane protein